MDTFTWNENFETGLEDVDSQHHRLVDLINDFGNRASENVVDKADLQTLFDELAGYAHFHFADEEALMEKAGMDLRHIERHRQSHQQFLEEVRAIFTSVTPDQPEGFRQLMSFLINWLVFHILGTDKNMSRQIRSIAMGSTPDHAYQVEEVEHSKSTKPLVKALNGLFDLVSSRNKALLELNESLEQMVDERTKALSKANAHLEQIALTDMLTGLPNRRHAMRTLEELWQDALTHDLPLVCIMIDADHFKEVNDTYGHDAGDEVLRELARTLRHTLRTDDIVSRLGGDEFFAICPDTDQAGGMHIAELIRKAVDAMRVPTGDGQWKGSISVGVAARAADTITVQDLIKAADEAVYAAKRAGKNCVRTLI
jgi:diguanylate cyclase (GGDEF)-like protein/hemerythrin-like metal-binding protein